MRTISSATTTGSAVLPGVNRLAVASSLRATSGSRTRYASATAVSAARPALGKWSVPSVKAPGMTITVSMPNWETS